jgi:hypothetical protein
MTKIDVPITVTTDFMTAGDDVSHECGAAHRIRPDQKKRRSDTASIKDIQDSARGMRAGAIVKR